MARAGDVPGADTTTYSYTGTTQTPSATQVGSLDAIYYGQGAGGLLAQQQSGTTRFDYTDPHGDLALLTTTTATPTGTLSYDPRGTTSTRASGCTS